MPCSSTPLKVTCHQNTNSITVQATQFEPNLQTPKPISSSINGNYVPPFISASYTQSDPFTTQLSDSHIRTDLSTSIFESPNENSISCAKTAQSYQSTPSRRRLASNSGRRPRTRASDSCCREFHDDYELLEGPGAVLGEGAYAVVRIARHRLSGVKFAVKLIDRSDAKNTREKCFNELRLLRACQNERNILSFHQYYEDRKYWYMIFEYVQGGNLQSQLEARGGKFSELETAAIIKDLANALAFLHSKRIAHRDLKPANILCENSSFASPCKIADFDLACLKEKSKRTASPVAMDWQTGSSYHQNRSGYGICGSLPKTNHMIDDIDSGFCSPPRIDSGEHMDHSMYMDEPMEMNSAVGSPEYMSPEIASRFHPLHHPDADCTYYTQACDIWSLGVITYVALSGNAPFTAQPCHNIGCQWNDGGSCEDCQVSLFDEIMCGELRFDGPVWDNVSNEAKHMIICCLERDSYLRISAKELLQHPFIQSTSEMNITSLKLNSYQVTQLSSHLDKLSFSSGISSNDDHNICESEIERHENFRASLEDNDSGSCHIY